MKHALWLVLLALGPQSADADETRPAFAGFVVHPRDGVGPEFEFSSARATADAPVVITVVGRKAKASDREHRTSLQKHWLQQNVPAGSELRMREQAMCDYGPGTGRCDRYEFEPGGERNAYYFYLNNWP
ncbi:hypothetical protein J5226_01590 [Lysobacter sp. K5869]|uniref:hypothetical protein n=1 Tax=Lysobacter sp. K5869 TaxID=2820808 RepID=UPI001C061878|nr:hypothetical protein [Lysobacter sp. K5869]QWP77125.1 hypothetical protein J5226_01590 [Lysobacter sp. K5869]